MRVVLLILLGICVFAGLYAVSNYNYLVFHFLVEMFSIAVAWGIFMLLWNSRKFMQNACFLLIRILFLYVGIIDIIHTLAYKGMGVFPGPTSNMATQAWIIARGLQSVGRLPRNMAATSGANPNPARARPFLSGFPN